MILIIKGQPMFVALPDKGRHKRPISLCFPCTKKTHITRYIENKKMKKATATHPLKQRDTNNHHERGRVLKGDSSKTKIPPWRQTLQQRNERRTITQRPYKNQPLHQDVSRAWQRCRCPWAALHTLGTIRRDWGTEVPKNPLDSPRCQVRDTSKTVSTAQRPQQFCPNPWPFLWKQKITKRAPLEKNRPPQLMLQYITNNTLEDVFQQEFNNWCGFCLANLGLIPINSCGNAFFQHYLDAKYSQVDATRRRLVSFPQRGHGLAFWLISRYWSLKRLQRQTCPSQKDRRWLQTGQTSRDKDKITLESTEAKVQRLLPDQ